MKSNIHPEYKKSVIICNTCKAEYDIGSTIEGIRVELCANCHPFYTNKEILVDLDDLVSKYNERKQKAEVNKGKLQSKKEKMLKRKQKAMSPASRELTLKDMLAQSK